MRRPGWPALLLLAWAGVVALFWWGLFAPSMRPGLVRPMAIDLYGYFQPKYWLTQDEILAGRLPLWNPYELAGLPLLGAAQPAALYPPKVLALALFPHAGLHAFMVAHYLAMGILGFLCLRGVGLSRAAAAGGVVVWTFNPYTMDSHYHPCRLAAATWMPLIFWLALRLLERPGPRLAAALALAFGLQLLAGYPEYVPDTAVGLAAFLAFVPGCGRWRRLGAALPWLAGSALLAAAVTAVQLVATLSMVAESARLAAGGAASFGASDVLAALPLMPRYLTLTFHLPAAAWVLVVAGVVLGAGPYRRSMLATLAVALGGASLLRPLLAALPLFSLFRTPTCWVGLAFLPIAYLVGEGLETLAALATGGRPSGELRSRPLRVGLAAALAVAPLVLAAPRTLLWLALGAAALGLALLGQRRARVGAALFVATLIGGVWTWNPPALSGHELHRYSRGEAPYLQEPVRPSGLARRLAALCGGKGRVLAPQWTFNGVALRERLRAVQGYPEPLVPARTARLLAAVGLDPHGVLRVDWRRLAEHSGVARMLGLGCIVVPAGHGGRPPLPGALEVGRIEGLAAYRFPHLPRAFFVPSLQAAAGPEAALAEVARRGFDPRRGAPVEGIGAPRLATLRGGSGRVRVARDKPGEIELDVEAERAGLLVVSEGYARGWVGALDGSPTRLYPADAVLIGIPVPRGRHRVAIRYRPRGIRVAVLVSAGATGGVLLLLLVPAGGGRRAARAQAAPGLPFAWFWATLELARRRGHQREGAHQHRHQARRRGRAHLLPLAAQAVVDDSHGERAPGVRPAPGLRPDERHRPLHLHALLSGSVRPRGLPG